MMNVSDTRDCAFEAFITNLGKYNEGFLVGEWVKFPVTNEEMQAVFRRIGIGRRYEEWFITDYDCPDAAIGKVLGEYESLSELNYLAGQIMELRESDDFLAGGFGFGREHRQCAGADQPDRESGLL